jgi:cyclophilin family peptidyl-prolyl cis-trans isomerase
MPFRSPSRRPGVRLSVTPLEGREVPAVNLLAINDLDFSNDRPLFVPVTNTATVNDRTGFTASSSTDKVQVSVLPSDPTVKTLRLDISGKDKNGQEFSGPVTIRLFTESAPLAVDRIVQLTNQGFYDNKSIFRIVDDFILQFGSVTNTSAGGNPPGFSDLVDEFNADFTFNSNGILAFANAKDDANGSQLFITDLNLPLGNGSGSRPQFLNFNHSIIGQVTSGFDTFTRAMETPVEAPPPRFEGDNPEKSQPIFAPTVTNAEIIDDKANSVVRIRATPGFTGPATITVNGTDADGKLATTSFKVNAVTDTSRDRPFIGNVPDVTVTNGGTTRVFLPVTNLDNAALTFTVGSPNSITTPPTGVTARVDAATNELIVTGTATGTTNILIRVNSASGDDTQVVRVNVIDQGATAIDLGLSRSSVGANRDVLLSATVTGNATESGTVRFFDGTNQIGSTEVIDGRAILRTRFGANGTRSLTADFTPEVGGTTTKSSVRGLTVNDATPPVAITAAPVGTGNAPIVTAKNADGTTRFTVTPFEDTFTGGVRVGVADVTGDGQGDLVTVAGFGGAPIIRIYDGDTGVEFRTVTIFEDTFRGGLYVDLQDVAGLGYAQIVVGAGFTGGPRISVYDAVTDNVSLNYFAFDPTLRSGVFITASDLRGGEQFQIIASAGKDGAPAVAVFEGRQTSGSPVPLKRGEFFAGDETDRTGRRIRATAPGTDGIRSIEALPFDENDTRSLGVFDPIVEGVFPSS